MTGVIPTDPPSGSVTRVSSGLKRRGYEPRGQSLAAAPTLSLYEYLKPEGASGRSQAPQAFPRAPLQCDWMRVQW